MNAPAISAGMTEVSKSCRIDCNAAQNLSFHGALTATPRLARRVACYLPCLGFRTG
jgi:hypothetical protein